MHSFDSHMKDIPEQENGSIDKLKADLGKKEENEVKFCGVKSRTKDFELI